MPEPAMAVTEKELNNFGVFFAVFFLGFFLAGFARLFTAAAITKSVRAKLDTRACPREDTHIDKLVVCLEGSSKRNMQSTFGLRVPFPSSFCLSLTHEKMKAYAKIERERERDS